MCQFQKGFNIRGCTKIGSLVFEPTTLNRIIWRACSLILIGYVTTKDVLEVKCYKGFPYLEILHPNFSYLKVKIWSAITSWVVFGISYS